MPSHIFTRVGAWPESAVTNRRSADVALKGNEGGEALHAMDYMAYAYLQLARDGDARKTYEEASEALKEYEQSMKREPERFRGYYGAALAAEMSGDAKSARKYYGRLVQMAGKGEARPELTLAKAYLSQ